MSSGKKIHRLIVLCRNSGNALSSFDMDIKPIRTARDHKAELKEIAALTEQDPELGSSDGDRLDIISTLVQVTAGRSSWP